MIELRSGCIFRTGCTTMEDGTLLALTDFERLDLLVQTKEQSEASIASASHLPTILHRGGRQCPPAATIDRIENEYFCKRTS